MRIDAHPPTPEFRQLPRCSPGGSARSHSDWREGPGEDQVLRGLVVVNVTSTPTFSLKEAWHRSDSHLRHQPPARQLRSCREFWGSTRKPPQRTSEMAKGERNAKGGQRRRRIPEYRPVEPQTGAEAQGGDGALRRRLRNPERTPRDHPGGANLQVERRSHSFTEGERIFVQTVHHHLAGRYRSSMPRSTWDEDTPLLRLQQRTAHR